MQALGNESGLTLHLTNSEGKIVQSMGLAQFDQNLSGNFSLQKMPAGTYWITVLDNNGKKIAEKRIQKI